GQLAWTGLGISGERFDGANGERRVNGNDEAIGSHARNRIEILDRIVERPALEQGLVEVRLRPAEQDGVAVRRSAYDCSGTERSAAPTDILDHHRAEERF